ncbi:hypothetical protein DdX_19645 [Ditylenchus destructor]|uniref:Uncharacterized protein n=1 Tax=Ditylenchus destructor TaxID=166010 RepID=A0AAD4MHK0_9BILA|nr:hypothetical protein DdX_19645 [Ditylenchus destructor]
MGNSCLTRKKTAKRPILSQIVCCITKQTPNATTPPAVSNNNAVENPVEKCLVNTLRFFNRTELECVSLSSKFVRGIVLKHFRIEPYFIIDGFFMVENQLAKLYKDDFQYFDLDSKAWIDLIDDNSPAMYYFHLADWLPHLLPWLRVKKMCINFSVYSETLDENIALYKLIHHLWSAQELELFCCDAIDATYYQCKVQAVHMFLVNAEFFRCKTLVYRASNHVPQLPNYPHLCNINVVT